MSILTKAELYEIIVRHIKIIENKISSCEDDKLTLEYLAMLEKFIKLFQNESLYNMY